MKLLALVLAIPIFGRAMLSVWPNTPIGRRFFLPPPRETMTIATTPDAKELEHLRGHFGKTLSPLRPAGVVDFDGRRIDAMSEGTLIDAGQWVRCVDVQAAKVVVRIADRPPGPANLEEMKL